MFELSLLTTDSLGGDYRVRINDVSHEVQACSNTVGSRGDGSPRLRQCRARDRLLEEDVLPRGCCARNPLAMQRRRQRDVHSVDFRVREEQRVGPRVDPLRPSTYVHETHEDNSRVEPNYRVSSTAQLSALWRWSTLLQGHPLAVSQKTSFETAPASREFPSSAGRGPVAADCARRCATVLGHPCFALGLVPRRHRHEGLILRQIDCPSLPGRILSRTLKFW